MKILFVGGGNMAQAIIGGLNKQNIPLVNLCVVEPVQETCDAISVLGVRAFTSLTTDLLECDAIILAVKPQVMKEAVLPMSGRLASQVVISIAAGIGTTSLARWLGGSASAYDNVVRAMPNTPALIGAGITGLYAAAGVDGRGRQTAEAILSAVGKTAWFDDETMLDAVTAVSGSGPAYVFYFIEALEEAALELGFGANDAHLFATQTFLGGSKLAASAHESPGALRARVTSKRGTTECAIEAFDQHALKRLFIDGVKAASVRSRELGQELGGAPIGAIGIAGGRS